MGKPAEERNYKMSDEALKQKADLTQSNATRDIVQFNTRGVTAATLTAFGTLITIFDNAPTDSELEGPKTVTTANKDAIANSLKIEIRKVRNMADLKFKGKGNYKTFGFKDMDSMPDEQLVKLGKKVNRVGTSLLSQLASEGLTAAILANILTIANNLDTSIDTQQIAIETRELASQDRITKGNAVYAELVRLCSIGKALFVDTDHAKYNDYVIDDSPSGGGGTTDDDGTTSPTP